MLAIPGLRPEKVVKLYRELGIASLGELEAAARADRLAKVKGLGPALQRKILEGIEIRRERPRRPPPPPCGGAARGGGEGAGEFRPRPDPHHRGRRFSAVLRAGLRSRAGRRSAAARQRPEVLKTGDMTVTLTDAERFGVSLLLATGSAAHLGEIRARAEAAGLVLGADGLRRGDTIIASRDEEEIYRAIGLPFIPPELREGRGEVELAGSNRLPKLVEEKDIGGLLHAHTVASDGADTLAEMAAATRARGYGYFGVADHSQSAGYAGGLSIAEVEEQHAAIDELNAGLGDSFRIFKGIEADILADGSLDYPDDVLGRFDFVIASVHSRFRLERDAQTERILRAVANPHTTILGHLTGRQLLRRKGYSVDIERILAACAEHGVAVEINANPWRLDLDWRWHARALELGCLFSINPDAHSVAELDLTRWGVAMARKGGVPRERVLNCLDRRAFAKFLDRRRGARPRRLSPEKLSQGRAAERNLLGATIPGIFCSLKADCCAGFDGRGRSRTPGRFGSHGVAGLVDRLRLSWTVAIHAVHRSISTSGRAAVVHGIAARPTRTSRMTNAPRSAHSRRAGKRRFAAISRDDRFDRLQARP